MHDSEKNDLIIRDFKQDDIRETGNANVSTTRWGAGKAIRIDNHFGDARFNLAYEDFAES